MIISNSRKFIFVHINKTAGTSVTDALYPHLAWNDLVLGSTPVGKALNRPFKERFGLYKHSTAREIRRVVGPEIWGAYTTFAVLRDPVERAMSLYLYLKRLQANRTEVRGLLRSLFGRSRPDWLATQAIRESDSFSAFIRHPKIREDPGFVSQHRFISDDAGAVIVDRLLRFESIEADFRALCAELGLAVDRLGHENRSDAPRGNQPVISQRDMDFLREYFAKDYALFERPLREPRDQTDLRASG